MKPLLTYVNKNRVVSRPQHNLLDRQDIQISTNGK